MLLFHSTCGPWHHDRLVFRRW